jgi:predicted MFS family arabinose efflux permease
VLGAPAFAQAVWNTSRVRELADPAYQARLQAITSMAFTLGFSLGMLWAGTALDLLGMMGLVAGAAVLGLISAVVVMLRKS